MSVKFGRQTDSGHLVVSAESKAAYADDVRAALVADCEAVMARYPQKRSALLPMLHLVQSVDGYVTGRGIELCAELLDLSTAEVSGVATFYTQYKRHPNGEYTVGVCTNTLCAVMGGDQIWETVSEHLGVGHDETTPDGKVTLERIECNAACDYAPVVMANWEFFDNQTPESTVALVDDLRAGKPVAPTRGPSSLCTFKQMSRILAGFTDGRADEGVGAGAASLAGLEVAHENGWQAPGSAADEKPADEKPTAKKPTDEKPADKRPTAAAKKKTAAKTPDVPVPGVPPVAADLGTEKPVPYPAPTTPDAPSLGAGVAGSVPGPSATPVQHELPTFADDDEAAGPDADTAPGSAAGTDTGDDAS